MRPALMDSRDGRMIGQAECGHSLLVWVKKKRTIFRYRVYAGCLMSGRAA